MTVESFSWTDKAALMLPITVNGVKAMAVLDTGCLGVALAQGFYKCAGLKADAEVEFTLTSAVNTNSKLRKVFKAVSIKAHGTSVKLPVVVLEGLHFEVLLGVNWMALVNAQVDIGKATLVLDGKEVPLKAWPENAGFTLKGACKVYSTKI